MMRLAATGLAAVLLATASAAQVDPFDAARSHIGARQNAEALAIIDSGQFDVSHQTGEGFSLLHYAASAGNLEMVRALIARGADPGLKSVSGTTPYQMAIGTLVQAEIRRAIAARAAPGEPAFSGGRQTAQPQPAAGRSTGGLCAIARDDPANSSRSPAERPFLQARDAIWYNHPDQLAGLVEDCVGVNQQDAYGWTLLHHAADRERVALARLLLEHGAVGTIRNKDGRTAAQLATSAEMRQLLGPAPAAAPAATEESGRKLECRQKYEADAALASDSTGRMRAMRRWQQCLSTGLYW